MNEIKLPIIKENRLDVLVKALKCIDSSPYNRYKQKDCIFKLYPHKSDLTSEQKDKSIYRGMILTSLRHLRLITGRRDNIRINTNGKLLSFSSTLNSEFQEKLLRTIICELDINLFQYLELFNESLELPNTKYVALLLNKINAVSDRQKIERITRWSSILKQVSLISEKDDIITLNKEFHGECAQNLDFNRIDLNTFIVSVLECYEKLSFKSAGVLEINKLRTEVALDFIKKEKIIVTENQFDKILRKIPFETKTYKISLGKAMSASENLFQYKNDYFRTIYINIKTS